MTPEMRSLIGFGPHTPKASCSTKRKTVQNTRTPITSEASVFALTKADLRTPLSTQPSNPTRSRRLFASLDSAFATNQPISKIRKNPRNFGMNVATFSHA
jgi:hypothetical protein